MPSLLSTTAAAAINAFIGPATASYVTDLDGGLKDRGYANPLLIMQAAGGVAPAAEVVAKACAGWNVDGKRVLCVIPDGTRTCPLGLLFRLLAPMRSTANMEACVRGVEAMAKEEAAYWLGMTLYRRNPRRVLTALRILLIDPTGAKR